jgi:hypothetical protein
VCRDITADADGCKRTSGSASRHDEHRVSNLEIIAPQNGHCLAVDSLTDVSQVTPLHQGKKQDT